MAEKSISAIYCDDIRHEIGGKVSLMGIYNTDMLFPSFPSTLPKLCAHVTVKFPWGQQPKKSLQVVLFKGEERLTEILLDEQALGAEPAPSTDTDTPLEDRMLALQVGFVVSPFQVDAPTKIRLRCYADGEEFKGNALRVRLPTDEERQIHNFPPPAEPPPGV